VAWACQLSHLPQLRHRMATWPRLPPAAAIGGMGWRVRRLAMALQQTATSLSHGRVTGYFFFAGLRLALLRPSYRGRRAGVDSFRFLRLAMVCPHSSTCRTNDIGEGGFPPAASAMIGSSIIGSPSLAARPRERRSPPIHRRSGAIGCEVDHARLRDRGQKWPPLLIQRMAAHTGMG
jgi:hypothetical protein